MTVQQSPLFSSAHDVTGAGDGAGQRLYYVLVPDALLRASGNNLVAIGIFLLIARLHFAIKAPVPLSAADIAAYDPTLTRGAILRAISKLVEHGFLVATRSRRKAAYTPAWGRVNQRVVIYDPDAPSLGKPRHLHALRIDRAVLDVGLGRLDPQRLGHGRVSRYTRRPILSLRDVGAYAAGRSTATLRAWQLVDNDGQPQPVDENRLLKLASQSLLAESADSLLSDDGYARLRLAARPKSAQPAPERGELLIYVPPSYQIDFDACFRSLPPLSAGSEGGSDGSNDSGNDGGNDSGTDSPAVRPADRESTPNLIENMIDLDEGDQDAKNASQCGQSHSDGGASIMSGTDSGTCQGSAGESGNHPPTPQAATPATGGGRPKNTLISEPQPAGETAGLLREIQVQPAVIAELADLAPELVRAAIQQTQRVAHIRDTAGYVVSLLRAAREGRWQPPTAPEPRCPTEPALAAYQVMFQRLPDAEGRQAIVETVQDMERWRATLRHWKLNDYDPRRIGRLLDCYVRGTSAPPPQAQQAAPTHQPSPFTAADLYALAAINRDPNLDHDEKRRRRQEIERQAWGRRQPNRRVDMKPNEEGHDA